MSPSCGLLAFLHISPWQQDPNKKAVVEKAVDSLKEKKNKTVDESEVLYKASVIYMSCDVI